MTKWTLVHAYVHRTQRRLFNFFLNDGCIPLTRDHRLMDKMVKAASDNG